MFKVSQEIHLGGVGEQETDVYGKYQKSPDESGSFNFPNKQIFVSPDVTEIGKVKVLHFPEKKINFKEYVDFVIKKNGARGNIEVKYKDTKESALEVPLQILDPDRFRVCFLPKNEGMHRICIKFNGIELPSSPFFIYVEKNEETQEKTPTEFSSDASKVKHRGVGLNEISIKDKNEFTIDASNAGQNILFVGICGPQGQCDEISIKHMGNNTFNVQYRVNNTGNHVIAVKWGDDHIPGSPFNLQAN